MKLKRIFSIFTACVMVTASFSGCGKTTATSASSQASAVSSQKSSTSDAEQKYSDSSVLFSKNTVYNDDTASDDSGIFSTSYDTFTIDDIEGVIFGKDASPQASPNLRSALKDYNTSVKRLNASSFRTLKKQADPEYKKHKKNWNYSSYSDQITSSVMRADDDILSIYTTDVFYANGAHPSTTFSAFNYDLKTGRKITLSNLFSNKKELAAALADDLKSQYPNVTFAADSSENGGTLKGNILNLLKDNGSDGAVAFYMTPTGVSFTFAPYALASYAAGSFKVEYSYDSGALTGNFNSKYAGPGTLKGKFIQLFPGDSRNFTENQDKVYNISIAEEPSKDTTLDDPSDYDVTVKFNGKKNKSTIHSFENDYYLAETKGGKYYLFVGTHEENDLQSIYIYDLNGSRINDPDEFEDGFYDSVPTNTDGFSAGIRSDTMSTYTTMGYFTVSDGELKAKSKWFAAKEANLNALTLKKDMTFKTASDTSASPEKLSFKDEKLTAGTKLQFLRTDNNKTTDLITDDDQIIRVTIDSKDKYPQTINGKSIEDIFKGIVFAG